MGVFVPPKNLKIGVIRSTRLNHHAKLPALFPFYTNHSFARMRQFTCRSS